MPFYRVIITKFDSENEQELVEELAEELEVSEDEAAERLEELPLTVARIQDEAEAEEVAELFEDLGAKVRIVESKRRRRRTADEDFDDEERPSSRRDTRQKPSNQRLPLIIGISVVVVLMVILGVWMAGGSMTSGAHRGSGANQQLAKTLEILAERYARGFQPDDQVAHGTLELGKQVTLDESVEGPACYAWIGFSDEGTDLDLFLKQSGDLVAQDNGEDNFPVVRHCVDAGGDLDLDVKMFGGSGEWVVQRYILGGEPGDDMLALMHKLYTSMFIASGEPTSPLQRVMLKAGQEREIPLEFDASWCYLPLGVSRPGSDLDMYLIDPEGREVERDDAGDNYPVLRHCPLKSGTYKLKLLMFGGEGEVAFRVYRGKLSTESEGAVGGRDQRSGQVAPLNIPNLDLGTNTDRAEEGAKNANDGQDNAAENPAPASN